TETFMRRSMIVRYRRSRYGEAAMRIAPLAIFRDARPHRCPANTGVRLRIAIAAQGPPVEFGGDDCAQIVRSRTAKSHKRTDLYDQHCCGKVLDEKPLVSHLLFRIGMLAIDELFRDIILAVRYIRKNTGLALVAIFSLALGIGINTAIFSVVDA